MSRWKLLLPLVLLTGCLGAATENAADAAQAAQDEPPFAPPAPMQTPVIVMGQAKVGQPVALSATAAGAADPVDYVWRIVDARGETVLTGQNVSYTPLTPTDHQVSVEVHDAYDRTAKASAVMRVALA